MSFVFTLLSEQYYLYPLQSLPGIITAILGWLAMLGLVIIAARKLKNYIRPDTPRLRHILFVLTLSVPLTSLFIGVRFSGVQTIGQLSFPIESSSATWMIFSALPWMLAGAFGGIIPAIILAALSGIFLAFFDSHLAFTPLIYSCLAVIFTVLIHQRYRTTEFRLMRSPFIASVALALIFPFLYLIGAFLGIDGRPAARLDFAFSHVSLASTVAFGQLVIAGIFCEAFRIGFAQQWGNVENLYPAPAEKSLGTRYFLQIAPIAFSLTIFLMGVTWFVAESAARRLLVERMTDSARSAAQGIPYFLGTAQNLMTRLSKNSALYSLTANQLPGLLKSEMELIPFFSQLFVLDNRGIGLTGYPLENYATSLPPPEEQAGILLALDGFPFQFYSAQPLEYGQAARVSFISPIFDQAQQLRGVLVGRVDLETNPLIMPVMNSLLSLEEISGEGFLLDENNTILFHPDPDLLMTAYTGRLPDKPSSFDEPAADGARRIVYVQPASGAPWTIVLHIPAQQAQKLALDIATPLLGMIIVLVVFAAALLRFTFRRVTESLGNLTHQANGIAQGQLDTELSAQGVDEVGQLSRSFEQMRLSLKARMDELGRLLTVSQGIAASLELSDALNPVLEAACSLGADAARIVLAPQAVPEFIEQQSGVTAYALGSNKDTYAYMDGQVLEMTRRQERVIVNNASRVRAFRIPGVTRKLNAFLALPLRHENMYYGVFWVAYEQPHIFTDEEVRFLTTLAGQAALATLNVRLFLSAEWGRQRLAAVLASTPDPVLVTDRKNHLLLSNPAAWRALGVGAEWQEGQPIEQFVQPKELLDFLLNSSIERQHQEIKLNDGKVYYTTVSNVVAEGQMIGRVCILRDISYFKQLDSLKSEFVATVSHVLRSPLTLVQGYATMLEMVGELNEKQGSYVKAIIGGVENMSRLVNNLLDLGRIEAGVGLQLELVPVQDVVESVVGALQLQASQKNVQLTASIPAQTIPLIEADHALLRQALHNLVDNGIKYTEGNNQGKGLVKVLVSAQNDSMIFEIQDNGIGIAPVDLPHIFEKFYRSGQEDGKKPAGSGLGLAIVKSIAERHGGKVWVESQLGKGSTFFLSIPIRQPKQVAGEMSD